MDREWINGGAKCTREPRIYADGVAVADLPKRVPWQRVLMDTVAVHISSKQLHCFSHNEGARVRSDRGGGRVFTEYRGFSPAARLRETIPQPHSLLGTMLVVKDIDDDDIQAQGHPRRINCYCIRLARNKWINPELGRIKKAS